MAITAAMVKELREISGAGMMDCKKALTATEGDMARYEVKSSIGLQVNNSTKMFLLKCSL